MPGYAAFGKVTKGMNIVREIPALPTGNPYRNPYLNEEEEPEMAKIPAWLLPQLLNEAVIISNIEIVE